MDSCRVVYLTTYLTAVILLASYSATVISFLTVRKVTMPFSNLEEFVVVGTHKLGALQDSTVLNLFKVSILTTLKKFSFLKKIKPFMCLTHLLDTYQPSN